MMRELGLFAGIGSFSLGLERSGLCKPVGFVEIDGFCQQILRKHWPSVPCYDNVLTREFVEGEADIITAGFPCQDLSYAGKGAGLAGERSGLWREVVRAVRLVRPKFTILENVAALLGRGLGRVLGDLAEIGHDAEWHCIPASAVGAPHRRDRIWIVANPSGIGFGTGWTWGASALREIRNAACADTAYAKRDELRQQPGRLGRESWKDTPVVANHGAQELVADTCLSSERRSAWVGWRGCGAGDDPQERGRGYSSADVQWAVEPDVGRVVDGPTPSVDRLRSLGNSLVPQIPEIIGKAILSSMHGGAR